MQQPVTNKHLCFLIFLLQNKCKVFHYVHKLQSSLSRLRSYCGSRSLLFARSRPGFQHVMLLLSVKAVQLVQVSSQLEHPCCLGITPLLTIVGHNRKVTITIVLSWDRCTMIFRKGCIFNIQSIQSAFCTYIKSYHSYSWRCLQGFYNVGNNQFLRNNTKMGFIIFC